MKISKASLQAAPPVQDVLKCGSGDVRVVKMELDVLAHPVVLGVRGPLFALAAGPLEPLRRLRESAEKQRVEEAWYTSDTA